MQRLTLWGGIREIVCIFLTLPPQKCWLCGIALYWHRSEELCTYKSGICWSVRLVPFGAVIQRQKCPLLPGFCSNTALKTLQVLIFIHFLMNILRTYICFHTEAAFWRWLHQCSIMICSEVTNLSFFFPPKCHLIHYLRLSHHLIVLNYLICTFDKLKSVSSEPINITDVVFDGVEVRVFEPPAKQDEPLKRSVVYIHGGGWALASASTCLLVTKWDSGLVSFQQEKPKAVFPARRWQFCRDIPEFSSNHLHSGGADVRNQDKNIQWMHWKNIYLIRTCTGRKPKD